MDGRGKGARRSRWNITSHHLNDYIAFARTIYNSKLCVSSVKKCVHFGSVFLLHGFLHARFMIKLLDNPGSLGPVRDQPYQINELIQLDSVFEPSVKSLIMEGT